jgi:hypothetical protein
MWGNGEKSIKRERIFMDTRVYRHSHHFRSGSCFLREIRGFRIAKKAQSGEGGENSLSPFSPLLGWLEVFAEVGDGVRD